MPILPLIGIALPALMRLAEGLFSSSDSAPSGAVKKSFVLEMLGKIYDAVHFEKFLPDLPGVDEKALLLEIASVLIDKLVPELFDAK